MTMLVFFIKFINVTSNFYFYGFYITVRTNKKELINYDYKN